MRTIKIFHLKAMNKKHITIKNFLYFGAMCQRNHQSQARKAQKHDYSVPICMFQEVRLWEFPENEASGESSHSHPELFLEGVDV